MRCWQCGWIVRKGACPCGATDAADPAGVVPVGTRALFRPTRGPSPAHWMLGEVAEHVGRIHKVKARLGDFWCEADDLLPAVPSRESAVEPDSRVWALWIDGRWYPGTVDAVEGPLRHVTWDDGDSMWLEASHTVVLAAEAEPPEEGMVVIAKRWDGEYQPARVEQRRGAEFRVTFSDGEEAWVSGEDLHTFPPNPFEDGSP